MAHMNRWLSLACCFALLLTAINAQAASRINRSGYIAISIDPILYESNLWESSHRISLDKFFTSQAKELGEALAEGLEKTAFRGQLRVIPGYRTEEQDEFRENGTPDTFLMTVDIRSRYGLTESSPAAACLSGITCFALSPVKMFTYESKTEATVTAFFFTKEGKRLRLVQERFKSQGEVSGDFYDAMDMTQELEWITHLTSDAIEDIRRQILAEVPTELVSRSWRKAADDLNRPPAGDTAKPGLPPVATLAKTEPVEPPPTNAKSARATIEEPEELNLQQLLRIVSPAIFKVRTEHGTGSGFSISRRGFGVTSLHIVDNVRKIMVQEHGGKERQARVIQTHPELDLAILSFEGPSLGSLRVGDSTKTGVGDKVVAIGYPLDVGLSITPSSISSVDEGQGLPLLHIETLVPPGNSGGPLVNSRGEVIGITFRKDALSGKEGTTLAIPINEARKNFEQFLDFAAN